MTEHRLTEQQVIRIMRMLPRYMRGTDGGKESLIGFARAIEAELSAPDTVRVPLAELGAWVLEQTRGDYIGSDLNGGEIQDKAEALGLLRRVEVKEPCGENCLCAEYYDSAEWPVECLRYAEGVSAMIAAAPKE